MRTQKDRKQEQFPVGQNAIAIQNGLILVPDGHEDDTRIAASLQAELMNLGHMLDKDAYKAVCKAPRDWILAYHKEIIPFLTKKTGNDMGYTPFYPNFPKQVMEMSEIELFINAVFHYLSNGEWSPRYVLEDRRMDFEDVDFKIIKRGTDKDFLTIFSRMVSVSQSLTGNDKEALAWFIDNRRANIVLPDKIPFKETLCILAAKGFDVKLKGPTDVLRVAVYLSGGDVSLPGVPKITIDDESTRSWYLKSLHAAQVEERNKFKFKRFGRKDRRLILGLLEKTRPDSEEGLSEMQSRLGRWLRLGEVLHPGEYARKFPRSAAAFTRLRNQDDEKIRTFNGRVDLAFAKNWKNGIDILSERPGEFARRLDWLVRTFTPKHVLDEFAIVGDKVSSKVLFELHDHFEARTKKDAIRSIMIKGATRSKMKVLKPLPPLEDRLVSKINKSVSAIIKSKIAELPKMGDVWIDERLKQVPVPSAMRSINTSIKTYVRGTRIPFRADAKVVRPFIHWYDEHGSIDLDLSVGMYDEKLRVRNHISFTSLKVQELNCCHSGDIRHRQGACAEYVDIDIARCAEKGIRYAIVQVHNYDGNPLHAVKDAVFGLMEREFPESNKTFVPKTISNCMGVANEASTVNICILDLQEKCYIWADLEGEGFPTIESTAGKSSDILRSLIQGSRMSVYDLLSMHAEARGSIVPSKAEADLKLEWEDFITNYTKIAGYMTF